MEKILEPFVAVLKDWVSLLLLGLGITFAPYSYFGGLFLAFAGAAISRAWEKEKALKSGTELPRESGFQFWLVVTTAFFVSTLTAIVVNSNFETFSIQVCMAVSGFASRKVITFTLNVMNHLSDKGDTVADKLIDKFTK